MSLVSYLTPVSDLDLAPPTEQFVDFHQLDTPYKGVLTWLKFDRRGGGCKKLKN